MINILKGSLAVLTVFCLSSCGDSEKKSQDNNGAGMTAGDSEQSTQVPPPAQDQPPASPPPEAVEPQEAAPGPGSGQ